MRLMRYDGTPEPGRWHMISGEEAESWRDRAVAKVGGRRGRVMRDRRGGRLVGPGGELEGDVVHVDQTTPARSRGDDASVDVEPREKGIREARETVDVLAKDLIDWVRRDPKLYQQRLRTVVQLAKNRGAFSGMTDDDAAQQLHVLCEKVAALDAEAAYAKGGYNRPQVLDGLWLPRGAG